jgi:L-histidine N-alpha-methyltransferase
MDEHKVKLLHKSSTKLEMSHEFAHDIKEGLALTTTDKNNKWKRINPKYLYDKIGSQLFEQICLQPEYYLTRVELAILRNCSSDIAKMYVNNDQIILVELGSGSSTKTRTLLREFMNERKNILYYFPVDLSHTILEETSRKLSIDFPGISVIGIHSDYIDGIRKVEDFIISKKKDICGDGSSQVKKLILFLGSSIGNFEPNEARSFLKQMRSTIEDDNKNVAFLIGFDLQKDTKVLEAAYNDKNGMTAKFNLNVLSRINRDLAGEFDLDYFSHYAFYNHKMKRIEMHLISKTDQEVRIHNIGKTIRLRKDETIHTENSYKYSLNQIRDMVEDSGFEIKRNFVDKNRWFNLAFLFPR